MNAFGYWLFERVRAEGQLCPTGRARGRHWHGAAPSRFMTDLAIREADDPGSPVTWREHMTDEEYNPAPRE